MSDPIRELSKLIGPNLRIGLRQQGHIPTVERMLKDGATWTEIGKAIGWNGETAKDWYERERLPSGEREP